MSKTKTQPAKQATMTIESKPQSWVYVLGIDKRVTYLATGNDLETEDFHRSYALQNGEVLLLEEDFSRMLSCTNEERMMFENFMEIQMQRTTGHDSSYNPMDCLDLMESDFDHLDEEGAEDRADMTISVRKNFPETWLFEKIKMGNSDSYKFRPFVPDSITSWVISAFSVHNDHGFALAKKRELVVTRQFFVKLILPYAGRLGEIIDVETVVFNFVKDETMSVTLKLKVNSDLEIVEKVNTGRSCNFNALSSKEQEKTVSASSGRGTKVSFYVRAMKVGNFEINIQAEGKGQNNNKFYGDAVEEMLTFEPSGVRTYSNEEIIFNYDEEKNFDKTMQRSSSSNLKCKTTTIELYTDTIAKSIQSSDSYK